MLRKILVFMFCAAFAALAGCAGAAPAASSGGDTTITGRVTAINGNNITIALFQNNLRGDWQDRNGTAPGGGDFTAPSGGPRRSRVPAPSGGWDFGANLTGESKTVTVSDGTPITFGRMGQAGGADKASLSDIQVGSIIIVTLSGDKVSAVSIMRSSNARNSNGAPSASPSAPPEQRSGAPSSVESAHPSPTNSATPSVGIIATF